MTLPSDARSMAQDDALPARKILYKYIRFSSIQQARGSSFARQNERLEKYAKENGFVVNDSLDLRDFAESGFHGINKEIDQGLGRFIAAIDKGLIPTDGTAYLAVEQFDRISREDIDKAQDLFKSILRKNVNVITLMDGRIYTKKSLSNFMEVLYSLFLMEQAHQESLKKSDRIKGAYTNKIKRLHERVKEQKEELAAWEKRPVGKKPVFEPLINEIQFSSQVPEWIDQKIEIISGLKFRKFVVNEDKAKIIRYALSLLNDDNGYMNVSQRLNDEEVPRIDFVTRRQRSTRKNIWTNSAVNNFVNSDSIFGELAIHDNLFVDKEFEYEGIATSKKVMTRTHVVDIPNYYPPVVDKKLIMGLRARANSKKKGRVAGRSTNDNLFQNMLFCGKCGDSMHMKQTKRITNKETYVRKYLACYSAVHKACDAKMIPYGDVEREIIKYLIMPFDENQLDGAAKVVSDSRNAKMLELEGEIKDIEDRIDEFTKEIKNNKSLKPAIALSLLSEMETDKDFKILQLKELQEQKDTIIESLGAKPVGNFDLDTEDGRVSFKIAVKQRYAGFVLFTSDQVVMVMHKRGGSEFSKIQVINRRGKAIAPERTADTMTLYQNMLNHIKELAKTYKEGKLYEIIKAYKTNDITLFEEDYKNRGLAQPETYSRKD